MKKMMAKLLVAAVFIFPLTSQSAGTIEKIAKSEVLLKGEACYIAGSASGIIEDSNTIEEAFNKFSHLKIFKNAKFDDKIRLDEFAALVLQSFNINESLWYKVTKTPYYALRQLKLMGLISQNIPSSSLISPKEAFKIINELIEYKQTKER